MDLSLNQRIEEDVADLDSRGAEVRAPGVVPTQTSVEDDHADQDAAGHQPATGGVGHPDAESPSPDLVATYFRQMGRRELLSREQEIALAKRIEAAQAALLAGLCGVPMLIARIDRWGSELREGHRNLA